MKAPPWLLACLLIAAALPGAAAELISTDGKSIQAEILAVRGNDVVIKRGTKQFTVPRNRFNDATRQVFDAWLKNELENKIPKLAVEINSGKTDRLDKIRQTIQHISGQ